MKVQNLPLNKIKMYWRNPRKNEAAVQAVAQSIQDYGFNQPIVLDNDFVIIVGHTRYKAAKKLNLKTAPCLIVDLPPEKAKEYRIADNKTNELSSWDNENLIKELREITNIDAFQAFFIEDLSDLVRESTGAIKFRDVTTGDIEKATHSIDQRHTDISQSRQAGYVEFLCPHCGGEITLNKNEL